MLECFDGIVRSSFMEVKPSDAQQRVAGLTASAAAKVLRIQVPSIWFFYRRRYEKLMGFTTDEGICIAADINHMDTARAVLHEMRHAWQRQSPEWRYRSQTLRERDAILFELGWPR